MDELQTQTAKPPITADGDAEGSKNNKSPFWKRGPVILVGTLAFAVLCFFGLQYVADAFTHESTDDAFLSADVVSIAPRVAGQVKKVCVSDNQTIKGGNLLVELDPGDFEIQLDQKKAASDAAESNIKLTESSIEFLATQVATAGAKANQSEAEATADQAAADKANADLRRAGDLIQKRAISEQEYDSAKAAAASANAALKAGQDKAVSDRSKIAETRAQLEAGRSGWERAKAQARQSRVDVQQADLNLSYTRITAPQDGRVTRKAVEAGDYVQVGQRLMAVVAEEMWIEANFKETQLSNIRPGQPVKISVDSVDGRTFSGRVDSIQAGSGAAFSLLPPENAVGNYVKVVQRVPVKIVFDKPVEAQHVLGPGMSVVPSVRVTNFEVPGFLIAFLSGIVAVIVGAVWWRAANHPKLPAQR